MVLATAIALLHWGFESVNITHKMTKKVYAIYMCNKRKTQGSKLQLTVTVANATNIFSLVTKNSGLVATLATRFLLEKRVDLGCVWLS